MTPAIAEALATIIASIAEGWSVRDSRNQPDGYHVPWPAEARMDAAGTALAAALGCGEAWDDVATALRALASPDVGLPEGWSMVDSGTKTPDGVRYEVRGANSYSVALLRTQDGEVAVDGDNAPPAVYLHLLRAAGVAS